MKKNGYVRFIRILAAAVATITAVTLLPLWSLALKAWEKNDDGYYYGATLSGEKLTKAPGVTCRGIDISTWNGALNWTKIKKQYDEGTISFIIIRCGYGANLEKNDDDYWKRNADACTKYGIPFGVYFYSYALTVEDALDEAAHALRLVDGYNPTYPIYYDFENTKTQSNLSGQAKRDIVYAFCDTIKAKGYEVGFYSMRSWIENPRHLGLVDYEAKDYSLWIAEFNEKLNYSKSFDIWQCTSNYKLTGQSGGTTDVSFSYITERTVNHCYVTFDMNGRAGTPPKAVHANKGEPYGALPVAQTDTGEHIIGWYTEPEGGELVTAETICKTYGRQTLYARWACDFELNTQNVTTSGGELKQTVTSLTPYVPVTVKANDGYYLPSRIELPDGYTYTVNDDGTAVINGDPHCDANIELFAVKNGELEPPLSTDFFPEASTYGGKDGSLGGLTSAMEVSIKGDGSDAKKIEAADGKTARIEGLAAGYVYVRYAATAEKQASRWIKVKIPSMAETPSKEVFKVTQPATGTDTGSIVCPDEKYEYSLDGGKTYSPIDTKTFTLNDLEPWKTVYVRRAETYEYKASLPVAVEIHPFIENKAFDYVGQYILTNTPDTTFIVNEKIYKTDNTGKLQMDEEWFGTDIVISEAALVDNITSIRYKLTVPAKSECPDIKVTDESILGKKDGVISGVTSENEFSTDGGNTWQDVTEDMVSGSYSYLYDTEYLFRNKAKADSYFCGKVQSVQIQSGKTVKVTYKAEGFEDTVLELKYGETVSAPELPVKEGANMKKSCWDIDLNGQTVNSDTTVNAVYVNTGWQKFVTGPALIFTTICVAFVVGGIVIFALRKRH